ncbi:hypothetical protein [Armatimonas sp.]|uniref:hypothetical protein n=1 Tax=Armatimonas sp. TaxID=1872638 RepID=UPI00286ADF66|nr:hypothetical protein [Armatimonas sp.]
MYTVKVYDDDAQEYIQTHQNILRLDDAKKLAMRLAKDCADRRNRELMGMYGKKFPSEIAISSDGLFVYVGFGLQEYLATMGEKQSNFMNRIAYQIEIEAG